MTSVHRRNDNTKANLYDLVKAASVQFIIDEEGLSFQEEWEVIKSRINGRNYNISAGEVGTMFNEMDHMIHLLLSGSKLTVTIKSL